MDTTDWPKDTLFCLEKSFLDDRAVDDNVHPFILEPPSINNLENVLF